MKKRFLLSLSLSLATFICVFAGESRARAALDSLDVYVADQERYQEAKNDELNKYKLQLAKQSGRKRLEMLETLSREYRHVNIDSALHYVGVGRELAQSLNDNVYIQRFDILRCAVLPIYGVVKDAVDKYESIPLDSIYRENKELYYLAGDLIYNFARDFYSIDSYKVEYTAKSYIAVDSLINWLEKGTPTYDFYVATRRMSDGGGETAISDFEKLLARIPFNDHLYARTAAIIGYAYINDPYHTDDAIYYLALSAMSDIATGNRETTSLHRLGKLLYDKGDIDRSYAYLTTSLATAVASGSRLRSLEIAEALPLVFRTVQYRDRHANHLLVAAVIVLSVLLLASIILFWVYDHNRRRLKHMKERLTSAMGLKDSYIRQILSLCGVYLTALENFNKVAGRKIKAGQVTDLLNMIESGRILREQLQTFYEVFDTAFLTVYPDFGECVNRLLLPDKRVLLKDGERMTPELRILVFMRLGLEDSAQISKFLGLSLNTIYTYRNKMKNRAIDRDNFEDAIRNIGNIS